MADKKLDLSNSKLILPENADDKIKEWKTKINDRAEYLTGDKSERANIYKIRRDFYIGDQAKYTNIVGLLQKEKKGHANAVINYAGKTATKIIYSLANNPPFLTFPTDPAYKMADVHYEIEGVRTQAVEDFVDSVLRTNHFWKLPYRRSVTNQVIVGDFALKIYPENIGTLENPSWSIKIVSTEKMENLLVGWRSDNPKEYDFVICEEDKTIQSIKEEWGIEVPLKAATHSDDQRDAQSGHNENQQWGYRNTGMGGRSLVPSGRNTIPTAKVREYDDVNVYAITINGEVVELIEKDGVNYPKVSWYILGENIPNPGSPWSISDIDYLIDANIELNEASNEERDYIRVGANTKYVAYNMSDFDPETVKTGSGGVIFVDDPSGNARFDVLNTNVNSYPADSFVNRQKKHIHDLGIPEVSFGGAGGNSGRAKAIDYQSMVDLTIFKRDSWELVLSKLSERIQELGNFYFKHEFFLDPKTEQFKARYPEYDWSDILPITESDKIVNVLNKVQMGLPFKLAFKELGYRDVDAVINEMKSEAQDPDLMLFRAKMYQLTAGVLAAQQQAMVMQGTTEGVPTEGVAGADVNAQVAGPTLTSSQNEGASRLPVSQRGGTTSYSSGAGLISRMRQNLQAKG